MNTSELTGAALDWAVAMADDRQVRLGIGGSIEVRGRAEERGRAEDNKELPNVYDLWMFWHPQSSWSQGGPIIEREGISVERRAPCMRGEEWGAKGSPLAKGAGYRYQVGPTPLIAAMRCYVASKLGATIEVPEELK